MAWDFADLNGNMIAVFLFGEAAIYFALETQGTVFALLNPEIITQVFISLKLAPLACI